MLILSWLLFRRSWAEGQFASFCVGVSFEFNFEYKTDIFFYNELLWALKPLFTYKEYNINTFIKRKPKKY